MTFFLIHLLIFEISKTRPPFIFNKANSTKIHSRFKSIRAGLEDVAVNAYRIINLRARLFQPRKGEASGPIGVFEIPCHLRAEWGV